MIISHKHKFIFFAVPKTATHAIRAALRQHMGEGDWEQQVLFGKQSLPIPEIAKLQHGHISVTQIRPHLSKEIWQEYFKFAFVRNPFDRFISVCFFLNRNNPQFAANALRRMKASICNAGFRQRLLVRPQVFQLMNEDKHIPLDYVGRYEDVQQSLDHVLDHLDLPHTQLESKNASNHRAYSSYYDEELREMVSAYYREDFDKLNYVNE